MRKQIVAGNWKMNTTPEEGVRLVKDIMKNIGHECTSVNYIVCPPFTHLSEVVKLSRGTAVQVGAQNCATEAKGAYTGEVSAQMIAATGAHYVILGHSERRQYYGETSELLRRRMARAFENDLVPIYCVGETLEERESGRLWDVVKAQLEEVLGGGGAVKSAVKSAAGTGTVIASGVETTTDAGLTPEQFRHMIVAYEPVWAIGTGKVATAAQAQQMHAFIRGVLAAIFGDEAASKTSILYGGSVKPDNAAEIFAGADVDGALVGGASLDGASFMDIGRKF